MIESFAAVYSSEGTGHRAAAEALGEAFLSYNPGGRFHCFDLLDFIPSLLKFTVSQSYVAMARYAPWLWGAFYWSSDRKGFSASALGETHDCLCRLYLPKFVRLMDALRVEAIAFTHYFGAAETAKLEEGNIPVFSVDTDFESHRFQRRAEFAWSFSGSEVSVRLRVDEGIHNTNALGIPIASKYKDRPSREEARMRLGIGGDERVILVSGGGIGAGHLFAAAKSLASREDQLVIVICGGNAKQYARMKGYFRYKNNVWVEGFVRNMEDYYAAADAAVMKPGGLSTSEALCFGLPMLLFDPVPGQEELNLAYLTSHGAARHLTKASFAAEAVEAIFDGDSARKMHEAALGIARPNAADEIIAKIVEMS